MRQTALLRTLLCVALYFVAFSFVKAQSEIAFTNKVTFTTSGDISGIRLCSLMPAPITNEYQEISSLVSNCGEFIDINKANKVLFFDGSFDSNTFDIAESFMYKTKPRRIDFSNKGNKNEVTGVDPNEFLGSDGTYIDVHNSTIVSLGNQLWEESADALDYAKRCYEYVASHYKYINGSWRTLATIIQAGGGECGDFTTLFVNLLRYKGIPARHNIGIWVGGGYHVWPDFYHEDYGWVPVDPTFKNSNPNGDYFGRYDGNLIIVSQGLTSFSRSALEIHDSPLQTYTYWYWYQSGSGGILGTHKTSQDYQVNAIADVSINDGKMTTIYNLNGIKLKNPSHGINIINGKKVFIK